ncbi:dopamine receptor 2-like isoform X1 [Ostrinia furnacalis]|nr:dopamine receptor 2-like isoform X1 [Ostrinia furnacalis]
MGIVTATTLAGNGAVLAALKRAQRSPAHYPLASLAAADLLVGAFVLPIAAARELFVFHLNWAICSCWSTLDVLCCTASILSLCALGWERWRGITAPLSRARRARQARLYAVLVWPVAAAVAAPTAFIPSPKHFHPGEAAKACTVNTNVGYVFFSTSFSFYLPASVMVTLYARILYALASPPTIRAHRGRSPTKPEPPKTTTPLETIKVQKTLVFTSPKGCHLNVPSDKTDAKCPAPASPKNKAFSSSDGIISRQRRATRTIVMLMTLFLVCWTPFFVMLPVDSLCECVRDVTWLWCTWLGYANSALNPLVYAAASPSVRQALHKSLTTSSSTRNTDVQLSPSARRP